MTTGVMQMLVSGVAVSLRWQPQGVGDRPDEGDQESIWSDTRASGGGQAFPFYYAANAIRDNFGPGTTLYRASASTPDIGVLASATRTLLVNQRATPVTVSIDGQTPIRLAGYEVRLL